jgi:hypothetical protein
MQAYKVAVLHRVMVKARQKEDEKLLLNYFYGGYYFNRMRSFPSYIVW